MPEVLRVKLNWTGFIGAPGYTNLYFSEFNETGYVQADADGAVSKASTFATQLRDYLPAAVTIGVDPTVEIVQSDTGDLVGFFSTTPAAAGPGALTGTYSAASGACISWGTNGIRNGRRIRGRTFVVPLGGSAYESNGTLAPAAVSALTSYANALKNNTTGRGDFGIWARPTTKTATDGVWYPAQTVSVKDKAAVLRSRRD
jgi:hypothetical protein